MKLALDRELLIHARYVEAMFILTLRHRLGDFESWKVVRDERLEARLGGKATGHRLTRSVADPNEVEVVMAALARAGVEEHVPMWIGGTIDVASYQPRRFRVAFLGTGGRNYSGSPARRRASPSCSIFFGSAKRAFRIAAATVRDGSNSRTLATAVCAPRTSSRFAKAAACRRWGTVNVGFASAALRAESAASANRPAVK